MDPNAHLYYQWLLARKQQLDDERRRLESMTEKDVCRATLTAMGKDHLMPLLDKLLMSIEELSRLKSENGRLNGALPRRRPPTQPHLTRRRTSGPWQLRRCRRMSGATGERVRRSSSRSDPSRRAARRTGVSSAMCCRRRSLGVRPLRLAISEQEAMVVLRFGD